MTTSDAAKMSVLDYLTPLRRWWWLIVVGVLIAATITYLTVRRLPPQYAAHATLMVGRAIQNPNPTDSDIFLTQQLANTYADIARRQPVRNAAQAALGLPVLPQYVVGIVPNTQLIELTVFDTSPERAAAVANELARQLINQTPEGTDSEARERQAFVKAELDNLQEKIRETRAESDKRQAELSGLFGARQIADAQAELNALQTKLATLQANYAALLASTEKGALNTIAVVEQAELPTVPVGPQRMSAVLLAAAVGLLLSGAGAYVLGYLDDSMADANVVGKTLGLSTLGSIPLAAGSRPSGAASAARTGQGANLTEGRNSVAEAYRVLRTNLQFTSSYQSLRILLVTSPAPGDGKSFTAVNLATALAQADQRVVLVDADISNPTVHRHFNLPNHTGLTTALLNEKPDLGHVLQESGVLGLRVLASGPMPPRTADMLSSRRMRNLLETLKLSADMIVIDSPPVLALVDATVLATLADGVLLVIDAARSRRKQAVRAKQALEQVKANILGVVHNRASDHALEYHNYYWRTAQHSSDPGRSGAGRDGTVFGRFRSRLRRTPGGPGDRGRSDPIPTASRAAQDRSAP